MLVKYLTFSVIFIGLASNGFAQRSLITGTINPGNKWRTVYIYSRDSSVLGRTDYDGRFKLKHVPYGMHDLTFSCFPYYKDTTIKNICIKKKSKLTFAFSMEETKFRYLSALGDTLCPECHSFKDVVPVIYGMARGEDALLEQQKKAILGGCLIYEGQSKWYCKKDHVFY